MATRKIATLISIYFLIFCSSAFSGESDDVGRVCNAALSQGLKNNYYLLSDRVLFEYYQRRLCSARYSNYSQFSVDSSAMGLSLPTTEGLLGLTGSENAKSKQFNKKYSSFCSSSYFNQKNSDKFTSYSSEVSNTLATNWERCHQLHLNAYLKEHSFGVFISATPQEDFREFTIVVENKQIKIQNIVISNISPENDVSCKRRGNKIVFGKTEVDSTSFQLDCTKSPYRSISFSLETNAGVSNVVNIPAQTSKILLLQNKNNELQNEISILSGKVKSLQSSNQYVTATINKIKSGVSHMRFYSACVHKYWSPTVSPKNSAPSCPAGWTDTGELWNTDTAGGGHGQGEACRVCYKVKF